MAFIYVVLIITAFPLCVLVLLSDNCTSLFLVVLVLIVSLYLCPSFTILPLCSPFSSFPFDIHSLCLPFSLLFHCPSSLLIMPPLQLGMFSLFTVIPLGVCFLQFPTSFVRIPKRYSPFQPNLRTLFVSLSSFLIHFRVLEFYTSLRISARRLDARTRRENV